MSEIAKHLGMTPAEYDDLQIWLRHGRIATGRSYQEEVERCRAIERASALPRADRAGGAT